MDTSYTVLEELGQNSTTSVYRAVRNCDELPVVLKHLPDGSTREVPCEFVFLEKVRLIDGCVKMLDMIEDAGDGKWTLVLEDLDAAGYTNLAETNKDDTLMDDYDVSWIMRELISVLMQIHAVNVLHCDIKLDNIFVDFRRHRIKLIDFNMATDLEDKSSPLIRGCTPDYAPPEVLVQRKQWTAKGEVWSVGCTAFVLLCKRFPFDNPWMSSFTAPAYPQCITDCAFENSCSPRSENVYSSLSSFRAFRSGKPKMVQKDGTVRLSLRAKDFLLVCLCRSPEQRPSLRTLFKHPFLAFKRHSMRKISDSSSFPCPPRTVLVS
ncbi:unnamed protein product [Calicophoron daubneyi]|uniref:Protein kinase domain-containing protein n=1 Tax=Calicophoron daubneyi TaxID=300641 RepID=A0AAV2T7A9_CALDB